MCKVLHHQEEGAPYVEKDSANIDLIDAVIWSSLGTVLTVLFIKASNMKKFSQKKVVFSFITLFIGFLFLEGFFHLYLKYSNTNLEPVVPVIVGQFDKRLGWSLRPLSRGVSKRTGYKIEYKVNSKGLRDNETTYEKPKGIFRAVLLGDSRTFGFGVPIEKHFSSLLEGYFKNLEIINMGVSGFGIDQELLYLQIEGFQYNPDLVIAYIAHYGNNRHMYTERFGKQKPQFILQEGKMILINSPVQKESLTSNTGRYVHYYLSRYSAVYNIVYNIMKIFYINRGEGINDAEKTIFEKETFEMGESIVREIQKESLKHESKFIVITHIEELHKYCLEEGILSLNVSESLSNSRFSLPDNLGHINESGNGVLAWEIAKFLRTNGLVTDSCCSMN